MTPNRTPGPWVYIKSEPGLWTVGFYKPNGEWEPESDHDSGEKAAKRINYLNGGNNDALVGALKSIVDAFGSQGHTLALRINGEHMDKVRSALRMAGEEVDR
jgi:hypothetical protein